MSNLWGREPALIIGAIQAVLALVVAFGLDLTVEQTGAILAASAAILAVVTRSQVTPMAGLEGEPLDVDVPKDGVTFPVALDEDDYDDE